MPWRTGAQAAIFTAGSRPRFAEHRQCPVVNRPLPIVLAGLLTLVAGCGGQTEATRDLPAVAPAERTGAQATPPPALAPGRLGSIADVPASARRIGYVDLAAAAAFGGPLTGDALVTAALGSKASAKLPGDDTARTAVAIGGALILDGPGRTVLGGADDRRTLASTTPQTSVITDETRSAVQSGLGDGVTEVILGPALLGDRAAIGASVLTSAEPPAGRKLLISAAPHLHRELDRIERALRRRFPSVGLSAAERPVIGFEEIGEREIVRAVVSVDQVRPALLRDLVGGGPALLALARAGR